MAELGAAMADLIAFLDEHQGALTLLSIVSYAVLTLLLYAESRAARLSAEVVAWAERWRWNEGVMAVYIENLGPAPARRVELVFEWRRPDGAAHAPPRTMAHPALAPGQRLPYAPESLLRDDEAGRPADEGLVLRVAWSWSDSRRPLLRLGERRHRASLDVDAAAFRDTVSLEPNMIEPDPMDAVVKALNDAVDRQERRRWLNSPDRDLPPEVRVHVEAGHVRARLALWRERFRYWVLRRGR